jgi:acetyl esterase/lipase
LDPIQLWPDGHPAARGEDAPRLTPFPLGGSAPSAAIVVCPGGGYRRRAAHEGEPIARWLNELGLAAFVLDYRVDPHRHPAPLDDAQRAIRTVRARADGWRVDPGRVGILGFSAGGHLAASAATRWRDGDPAAADPIDRQGSRPDLAILCYPVITFGPHRHAGSMTSLLGDDPPEEARAALSAERQVGPATPPTFLWHTAEDAAVPVQNSLLFAAALAEHGVPFALHVFPRGRHGLGLAGDDPVVGAWTGLCAAWLRGQGFAP